MRCGRHPPGARGGTHRTPVANPGRHAVRFGRSQVPGPDGLYEVVFEYALEEAGRYAAEAAVVAARALAGGEDYTPEGRRSGPARPLRRLLPGPQHGGHRKRSPPPGHSGHPARQRLAGATGLRRRAAGHPGEHQQPHGLHCRRHCVQQGNHQGHAAGGGRARARRLPGTHRKRTRRSRGGNGFSACNQAGQRQPGQRATIGVATPEAAGKRSKGRKRTRRT
jgi:hypothetical protein